MTRLFARLLGLALLSSTLAGCLDALYEPPKVKRFAVCCEDERVTTCLCPKEDACTFELLACSEGACREVSAAGPAPMCSGGGFDAGQPTDAGMPPMDGGVPLDAGPPVDGGVPIDAGPPVDGGVPLDAGQPEDFRPCCAQGTVTTCPCLTSPCAPAPFTPCAMGTCRPGDVACD